MKRVDLSLLLLLVALSTFIADAPDLMAQTSTARLSGRVSDDSGAAIPGASVVVINEDTGLGRNTLSNEIGEYSVPALQPGSYRVEVELSGFHKRIVRPVALQVNQVLRIDVVLSVGGLASNIEVVADVPSINTEDASIGQVIANQPIVRLPLNGRQFLDLAKLSPGVSSGNGGPQTGNSSLFSRPGQDSSISVSGSRSQQNNFLLDGTQNTDGDINSYVISPSADAVEEFKVQTSNYSAEFGRSSGGQINVVTKSGTNDFHGTVFNFLRNDALDARPFNQTGSLPEFRRNQFGGTVGGPIQRERTFFFGSYEGLRLFQGLSRALTVPTVLERQGNFSESGSIYDPTTTRVDPANPARRIRNAFADGAIPPERQNPIARALIDRYVPLPNRSGRASNYLDNTAQIQNSDQVLGRLDHRLTERDLVFGRYAISNEDGFQPVGLPGSGAFSDVRAQNLTIGETHTFSPRVVNETRFGFARLRLERNSENAYKKDVVTELGIPGVQFGGPEGWGIPSVTITGYTAIGDDNFFLPFLLRDNTFHFIDTLSVQRGKHTMKTGVEFRRFQFNVLQEFTPRGDFRFTSRGLTSISAGTDPADRTGSEFAAFLLGLPSQQRRTVGIVPSYLRQLATSVFFQDDWKASPRLTLNLGLRYELVPPLVDKYDRLANLRFPAGGPPEIITPFTEGVPRGLTETDYNNFAPRLGFAYRPSLANSAVVRGGFGIFYGASDGDHISRGALNAPFNISDVQNSNAFTPEIFGIGFTMPPQIGGGTLRQQFVNYDLNLRTPYTYQWNLAVQHALPFSLVAEVAYVGSASHKLDGRNALNDPATPGASDATRPFQSMVLNIGNVPAEFIPARIVGNQIPLALVQGAANRGNANYHGLLAKVERRMRGGLWLLTSYTWSKAITDTPAYRSQGRQPSLPINANNAAAERALAGFDIRHRFVQSFVVQLPLRFEAGGILQLQSGFPFTVTASPGGRADVVPGQSPNLASNERTVQRWFNTAAFRQPAPGTWGNAGNNTVTGPGMFNLDVNLRKTFFIGEQDHFEFRAEAFNVLNHPNYGDPGSAVGTASFGVISSQRLPARQIQFGLKFNY